MEGLDTTLRTLLGYRMRRATTQALLGVAAALAPVGLRRTTFSALTVIVEHPGLNQSQLAQALDIERPNLVKIVDELERARLIERRPAPQDARAYALHATDLGRKTQAESLTAVQRSDATLTRGLTPAEVDIVLRALPVIEANARAELRRGPALPATGRDHEITGD